MVYASGASHWKENFLMYRGIQITPPFFEVGPKAYLFGSEVLELARQADKVSARYKVQIIFTPQYVDIPVLAGAVKNVLIFAQHMDDLTIGRGVGSVLPEAVKAAGAAGVLLNHAERKLPHDVLERTIRRADEVGLASMACADDLAEALEVARMAPNIIIVESPGQIGVGKRAEGDREMIARVNAAIWQVNPEIRILHGAGISSGQDVYNIISAGAQAAGSTSGIIKAINPFAMLEEMISSLRAAWDQTH
jgi:triosephosphate isomerase